MFNLEYHLLQTPLPQLVTSRGQAGERAILNQLPCPVVTTDSGGRIMSWNVAMERLFGFTELEAIGDRITRLLGERADSQNDVWSRIASSPRDTELPIRWMRRNGSPVDVLVSANRLSDEGDGDVGYALAVRQLPFKEGPLAATASADVFGQPLLEAQSLAGIGSWAFDARSGRIYWSEATFELYGIDPRQGAPSFDELVRRKHPDDQAAFRELVFGAIENERAYNLDNRVVRPDGSVRYVHTVGRPMRDAMGNVIGLVGTALDITERKMAELALRESEERFRTAFERAAIGMAWINYHTGRYLQVNKTFSDITGYSESELRNRTFMEISHPPDLANCLAFSDDAVREGKDGYAAEKRYIRKDGRLIWTRTSVGLVRDQHGAVQHYIALIEDISNRKVLEERWQLALEGSNDGLFDWDLRDGTVFYSPRWKEMLGFGHDELPGVISTWESLVHPVDLPGAWAGVQAHLDGKTAYYFSEYRIRTKSGSYKWILARGKAQRDESGKPIRVIGAHSDITARKLAEEQLRFKAAHDQLTGLANRGHFLERFESIVDAAQTDNTPCCLCICDIDRFKVVNDRYGHHAGDTVLVYFASLLQAGKGDGQLVGRLGGDEFHVIMPGATRTEATAIMERVRQRLTEKRFSSRKGSFAVTASFGVAELGPDMDAAALSEATDQALYHAKELGRNCVYANSIG